VIPFITTVFFIVGFCSLGLPGLSGFVAEMTVFIGSWQKSGTFYRVATIAGCMSIVVTAVYILRAIGQVAMGPLKDNRYVDMKDATWNEKLAAVILVAGIVAVGVAPFWLSRMVGPDAELIMNRVLGK
jgi:NADH-quinone oxidoreductase subunit M